MNAKDLALAVAGVAGNLFAWMAQTEEIWMSIAGAYVRYLAPGLGLPDLRGPFLFLSLVYIGFRLSDLWDERDEVTENL
ncbi:hypothetical protein [Halorussus marinus]|uniref:hypothetical protein n=1 Tax=Halorussus marinus TaxID=2505976 RepID=UPI00106ECE76|nr:hypothetical protein [Halorussus marinus]